MRASGDQHSGVVLNGGERRLGTGLLVALLAMLLSAVGAVTTAYAVDPPGKPTVSAPKTSATSLDVSWPVAAGAVGYRLQYSTSSTFSSPKTLPDAGSKTPLTATKATLTGLATGTTYYIRVAAVNATNTSLTSGWSPTATGRPSFPYAPPMEPKATKVTKSGMQLTWKAVGGAPGYEVRAYSSGNPTLYFRSTSPTATLSGLKANTRYYVRVYVFDAAARQPLSDNSLEIQVVTSTYAMAAPDNLAVTDQQPYEATLAWDPVSGFPTDGRYVVEYALDAAITNQRKTATFTTTTGRLTGLAANTSYFAKVYAAKPDGTRLDLSSDFVLVKTLVPRGTIVGRVNGETRHLTASAYDSSGEMAQQVDVGSDGRYRIDVRPGTYRVQISYVGSGNFTSPWVRSGSTGGRIPSESTPLTVARGKDVSAPDVTVRAGAVFSGVVRDSAGKPVRDVDVTAITYLGTAREVEYNALSASDGTYMIQGLPDGDHWIRYIYSGDGFATRSIAVRVKNAKVTGIRVSTNPEWTTGSNFTTVNARLDNVNFRKSYKAYIQGTTRVGSTVNVWATAWLAGDYPTTRATMTYQWKRDGKPIAGATGKTYKLTKADRGRMLTVTVKASRYGYHTGYATSTAKKIS